MSAFVRFCGPLTAVLLVALPLDRAVAVDSVGLRVMAGLRPIRLFGAELDHIDLGHPSSRPGRFATDLSRKGTAAFGVLSLPLPSPGVDVYAKAGLARLKSTVSATAFLPGAGAYPVNHSTCNRQLSPLERTDTRFAGGAGTRFKLGSWVLRAEYEQFIAVGGHPRLLWVGFTWNFR